MAERPFLCIHCGNWYIKVPTEATCWSCAEGKHAPNAKTGVVDCHFGQESAMPSEIKMAGVLSVCQGAVQQTESAVARIQQAKTIAGVQEALGKAETAFAAAERAQRTIPDIIKWAGVMEMPGMTGESNESRYKNIDALNAMVSQNRRPGSDRDTLLRSMRTCDEMADEVPVLIARARVSVSQARQAAEGWVAPASVTVQEERKVASRKNHKISAAAKEAWARRKATSSQVAVPA